MLDVVTVAHEGLKQAQPPALPREVGPDRLQQPRPRLVQGLSVHLGFEPPQACHKEGHQGRGAGQLKAALHEAGQARQHCQHVRTGGRGPPAEPAHQAAHQAAYQAAQRVQHAAQWQLISRSRWHK